MRSVQSGGETTKATMLAREMIEMMRADVFDSLVSGYNGVDTSTVTVTCPVTPPVSPDSDYNKKKWKCDMAASGTQDSGRGLPGGRGTIAVTCVDFAASSPFNETSDPACAKNTRKVTVTLTWSAQASRTVSLVTYVTRLQ